LAEFPPVASEDDHDGECRIRRVSRRVHNRVRRCRVGRHAIVYELIVVRLPLRLGDQHGVLAEVNQVSKRGTVKAELADLKQAIPGVGGPFAGRDRPGAA
jgi:hypothetical protein